MSELTPKHRAAEAATHEIQSDMRLGLGSGSTVNLIAAALGARVARGEVSGVRVVVASHWTEAVVRAAGLTLTTLDETPQLDLALDGADEIDPQRAMIKGGGGALLRERIVLAAADQRVIVVDESKLVRVLGERFSVPVEVVPFGWRVAALRLRQLGVKPVRREVPAFEYGMGPTQPLVTDEGNYIFDCAFGPIADPAALDRTLRAIPGVMDHGLFLNVSARLLVGGPSGVREL